MKKVIIAFVLGLVLSGSFAMAAMPAQKLVLSLSDKLTDTTGNAVYQKIVDSSNGVVCYSVRLVGSQPIGISCVK